MMSISEKEELSLVNIKFHDNFFKDLDKLSNKDVQICTTGVQPQGLREPQGGASTSSRPASRPRKILEKFLLRAKKRRKIVENPKRQKHLHGASHCYREPITKNIMVVYFICKDTIWFLTIGSHDKAYDKFKKRLHQIKIKYRLT